VNRIVVIGGGGHAKVLISVLKRSGHDVAGYTDREDRGLILGVPYLGDDRVLDRFVKQHPGCGAIIGMGKTDASDLRLRLQDEVGALGFGFPAIYSPRAVVNEAVTLGAGTAVFDGVVVNSGTTVGRACILNTSSIVEHDCRIGDNVHIAPGATLSGGVSIGDHCMVGVGASIVQAVSVCMGCLIGAGSTVVEDLTERGTYAGNPARRIR
jgi:sugar O-acyltransferase (sialic acid O-acetyltransferase NeuD family)